MLKSNTLSFESLSHTNRLSLFLSLSLSLSAFVLELHVGNDVTNVNGHNGCHVEYNRIERFLSDSDSDSDTSRHA